MRNIALQLAYDGTDFVGSQWQNQGRTVQGELEGAWSRFAQEERRFVLAGRTDAGVHAQAQVANIRTSTRHTPETVRRGLNALLPEDISVLAAWEVPHDFHARYSAVRREYRYLVDNHHGALPLMRNYALHIEQPLDMAAMQQAATRLEGEHDFAAFTVVGGQQRSTRRYCWRATCTHVVAFDRRFLAIELAANAFLHHMVRVIVGTLLLVGRGRMTPQEFADVLASGDRRRAGPTASGHGLTLCAVLYPDHLAPPLATSNQAPANANYQT